MNILFLAVSAAFLAMGNPEIKEAEGYVAPSEIKIENGVMTPEALLALGRLTDPQLSPDGKTILYGVSYIDLKGDRSVRNIFVCKTDGSGKIQLTKEGNGISNARWSKNGKAIYFIQDGQLWKAAYREGKLGKREKLSDVPAGISEFKLSPDEAMVMYVSSIKNQMVEQPVDSDPALDKAQAYSTENLMYRHWDHWVTEIPRTYVATLSNGTVTKDNSIDILGEEPYELPTEPFGGIEQLDWAPDGRHIAYSCRKHTGKEYAFSTNTGIFVYDILTGETREVWNKGGYDTDPLWSEDGRHLAWISMSRDGYEADAQRIMLVDVTEEKVSDGQCFGMNFSAPRQLASSLDRDASGLVWKGERIYFAALTNETQAIYSVSLDDKLERLTPKGWNCDFFSPFAVLDDGTLLTTYYSLEFPAELVCVKPSKPEFVQITHENDHILGQLDKVSTESVYVETTDGKQMQCWVMYPPHFDPNKKYPALEVLLGGPQSANSQDWSYRWNYLLMAHQGYVVIMPNRRGTTAFGQEWKEEISGDYSGLNLQDLLCAGKYLKSKPYVSKLAAVGASYGGYSAYMLEGMHGDLYDCFVAHAGIFSERELWFTTEEMWFANWDGGGLTEYSYIPGQQGPAGDGKTFGGMQQAGAPYSNTPKALHHYGNEPSTMVTKWHTPILCIHGMLDFRIPYTQGMAAFNAAQMMGVPSKLVVFPEENHWVLKPQNALYWHRTFFNWLDRWMKQ